MILRSLLSILFVCLGLAPALAVGETSVQWGLKAGSGARDVCVYDATHACVPIGSLNSSSHTFTPSSVGTIQPGHCVLWDGMRFADSGVAGCSGSGGGPNSIPGAFNLAATTAHDGVTDDYAAIQAVFNACDAAGGGTIYAGSYRYAIKSGSPILPPVCTLKFDRGGLPEVQDYSGDYTKVRGAFVLDAVRTFINVGRVEGGYVINGTCVTSATNARAVLDEVACMTPPQTSVTITAAGYNGHAVVNWTGHGLGINSPVQFYGSLPSGLAADQVYWVAAENFGVNKFEVSLCPGCDPFDVGSSGTITAQPAYVGVSEGWAAYPFVNGASARDAGSHGLTVIGWNIGVLEGYTARNRNTELSVDANTCVHIHDSWDFSSLAGLRCEGFLSYGPSFDGSGFQRTDVTGLSAGAGGSCRVAMLSTAAYRTGDQVWSQKIGGMPSCNGRFRASVVDGQHVDLIGSSFTGGTYTTGCWGAGQSHIGCLNGLSNGVCSVGSNVTGPNIPASAKIVAVNFMAGKIQIDKTLSGNMGAQTVTCTNTGYSVSAGYVYQSFAWRPGPGVSVVDATGGNCVDCFVNTHRTAFYFGDGRLALGGGGFTVSNVAVDSDSNLADLDTYGVWVSGHSSGVNVTGGVIVTMGVDIYVNTVVSNYASQFTGIAINSDMGSFGVIGIIWDIESPNIILTGITSPSVNTYAWFGPNATNTSVCNVAAPWVTVAADIPPSTLTVSKGCGNTFAGGYIEAPVNAYTPTITPSAGTAINVSASYLKLGRTLYVSGQFYLTGYPVTSAVVSLPGSYKVAQYGGGAMALNTSTLTPLPVTTAATANYFTINGVGGASLITGAGQWVYFTTTILIDQ